MRFLRGALLPDHDTMVIACALKAMRTRETLRTLEGFIRANGIAWWFPQFQQVSISHWGIFEI